MGQVRAKPPGPPSSLSFLTLAEIVGNVRKDYTLQCYKMHCKIPPPVSFARGSKARGERSPLSFFWDFFTWQNYLFLSQQAMVCYYPVFTFQHQELGFLH